MSQLIAILSSTKQEIAPLLQAKRVKTVSEDELYVYATDEGDKVHIIISGAAALPMTYRYTRYLSSFAKPDYVIQVGIAGAFDESLSPGELVEVSEEFIAGFGAEERDGAVLDMFDLGLWHKGVFPFTAEGSIINPKAPFNAGLMTVRGLTINIGSGRAESIYGLKVKYPDAQVETMEGGHFFYVSALMKVPFVQIRAISNYVEPRARDKWEIDKAISALNDYLLNHLP